MARVKPRYDVDTVNAACLRQLDLLVNRLFTGLVLEDDYWIGQTPNGDTFVRVHKQYGGWELPLSNKKGVEPVKLVQSQLGMSTEAAIAWIVATLNLTSNVVELQQPGTAVDARGRKIPEKTVVYPVDEEHAIDWKTLHETRDAPDNAWRRYTEHFPSAIYVYRDAVDRLLFYVLRVEQPDGKKHFRKMLWVPADGWMLDSAAVKLPKPWPLYGLALLKQNPDAPVLIVEGEKACEAARQRADLKDVVVIAWPGGVNAIWHVDWSPLEKRVVAIWPDADAPGVTGARHLQALLRQFGVKRSNVVTLPDELPVGWDLADELPKVLSDMNIREMVNDAFTVEPLISKLNERYFVVELSGKVAVCDSKPTSIDERVQFRMLTASDFRLKFSSQRIPIVVGKQTVEIGLGDYWIDHPDRRQYDHIVFDPSGKPTPSPVYNLWRGFSLAPEEGDWSLYRQHVFENLCQSQQHLFDALLDWMAFTVQHPNVTPGYSIVLRGGKGTGKSIFANLFGDLFGPHYLVVSSSERFVGRFNSHLRYALVVFAEEAFWAGSKTSESALKTLITEDWIDSERKGVDPIQTRNYVHLIIGGNAEWQVPTSADERRFFVLDVGSDKQGNTDFFEKVRKQFDGGGGAAMLYDLLRRDVSKFVRFKAPFTIGLRDQFELSMDSKLDWWYSRLREGAIQLAGGRWPDVIDTHTLYADYITYSRLITRHPLSHQALMTWWVKQVYGSRELAPYRKMPATQLEYPIQNVDAGARIPVYDLPTLALCRKKFEERTTITIDWPAEDTESAPSPKELPF